MTPQPAYIYRAKVADDDAANIHDGDTFTADVDCGFDAHVHIKVRIHGINAPELSTADGSGTKARAALQDLILDKALILQSYHDAQSFARWVCDVWNADGSVGAQMIANGYAVAYMGTPLP